MDPILNSEHWVLALSKNGFSDATLKGQQSFLLQGSKPFPTRLNVSCLALPNAEFIAVL